MKNTVLIVDDEIELGETLRDYLFANEYNALLAQNVDQALDIISKNKIDIILSDIQMPEKTGLDFFKLLKEKQGDKKTIPFILMTGFADVLSVENAFKIGVDELIAKPFDLEAITLVIDYLLKNESSFGSANEKFFSIPIQEIILSKTSDYTLYLRLIDKYVRVTKSGQDFTPQRLSNFAHKGVTHIYLNTADFAKYTDLQFALAGTITKRPLDEAKKIKIMNQLISIISQNSVANQLNKKYLDQSIQAFEAYTQVALNNSQLTSILATLNSEKPDLAEQSSLRAIICSSIAYLWKWKTPKVQSRIILAALLADVGLKDNQYLLQKKKFEYTAEENKTFEQHPLASHEILRQIDNIPEEILVVALQHHENPTGLGFPQKLPRSKIHPYSKLVQGVGTFIDVMLIQDDRANIKRVLDNIYKFQSKTLSEQVLKSLYILFELEVPESLQPLLLPDETSRVV